MITNDPNVLATHWGWNQPTKEIIDMANMSMRFKNNRSGEEFSELCKIDPARIEKLLEKKPPTIKSLEWIAQHESSTRPLIEKVLALKNGYAFYDAPSILLSVHPLLSTPSVLSQCDKINAALMLIEEKTPCLIFTDYQSMLTYLSYGRQERAIDPIRIALKNENIFTAVGKQDDLISILNNVSEKNEIKDIHAESIWFGGNVIGQEQKQAVRILDYALANHITDIALVPQRNGGVTVLMRKYGDIIDPSAFKNLSVEESDNIVNFLMAKSGANPSGARVREPRDGQITYRSTAGDAFFRLSFIPLNHPGLSNLISVSIRIFLRTEKSITLNELCISSAVSEAVSNAAAFSQGLILIAGPTNTGKSTLVAAAIGEHQKHFGLSRKRLSIENPIERFLPGITQINVPDFMENGFFDILRAIKRHDPDAIWIGEIRDTETAEVCVASAVSGHLVFSTLHANNTIVAYDVLSKSVSQEKRHQLIEALSLIVSQRLAKKICPLCSVLEAPTPNEIRLFNAYSVLNKLNTAIPKIVRHANQDGCDKCSNGYVGVMPINEVLPITRDVKDAMFNLLDGKGQWDEISKYRTITLFDSALELVKNFEIGLEAALI